jgi:LmbE family N-acetylglucosaminyl deacetylase
MLTDRERLNRRQAQPAFVKLHRALTRLTSTLTVMNTGAHPDDEQSGMLALMRFGMGMRTIVACSTRGEGGQNLIGPELNEGLGLLRTGELISARSLDGGEQFFTRAFDFGFSKSAEETFRHWPEEELLRDVVRVVRTFRPHVILSIFSGTPRDGHGQHQASSDPPCRCGRGDGLGLSCPGLRRYLCHRFVPRLVGF